jgi:hypothetical protein
MKLKWTRKMETKFWGYGFPFSSTLVFGEISDLARRRGLGMNAGRIFERTMPM